MCGYRHSLWKGESTCIFLTAQEPFKENGDWGNKKKGLQASAYGNRSQLDENGNQKLGRRNEIMGRVRVDRFEPTEKNGGSVAENRGKIM